MMVTKRISFSDLQVFDKISSGSGMANEPSYQLANDFHRPIIQKSQKRKVYLSFRDNIWNVNLDN